MYHVLYMCKKCKYKIGMIVRSLDSTFQVENLFFAVLRIERIELNTNRFQVNSASHKKTAVKPFVLFSYLKKVHSNLLI